MNDFEEALSLIASEEGGTQLHVLHLYAIGPIDWWTGWQDVDSLWPLLMLDYESDEDSVEAAIALAERTRARLQLAVDIVKPLFANLGWEGDTVAGPFLAPLPDPMFAGTRWMVALKQSNNGMTFISSPFPLSHLDEFAHSVQLFPVAATLA